MDGLVLFPRPFSTVPLMCPLHSLFRRKGYTPHSTHTSGPSAWDTFLRSEVDRILLKYRLSPNDSILRFFVLHSPLSPPPKFDLSESVVVDVALLKKF